MSLHQWVDGGLLSSGGTMPTGASILGSAINSSYFMEGFTSPRAFQVEQW